MLKNIPANMQGYKLMITEAPVMKTRTDKDTGEIRPVTDRQGVQQFVVSLFAKKRPVEGQFAEKGEEIKVTLTADPGEGFEEGTYVQLIDTTMSHWENEKDGKYSSGIWFRANGLTPA
ncbi:hypothetical protein [Saccharopolyspora sp. 6V]|uniref:hypothetical protein n=1 Tax=Saccharopolyspora sp. 6V TaxID=2877239 RepID=UPI001CD2B3D3|nr:hypothetical protein [Saccharopolyspora sp. 6V]MCA1195335.1 hypothetical protein [Saccharopolyspora sp. 6V]